MNPKEMLNALLDTRSNLAQQMDKLRRERDELAASVEGVNEQVRAVGKQIKELQPAYGENERSLDAVLTLFPSLSADLDRSARPYVCCRQACNLDSHQVNDKFIEKCRSCGRRHFGLHVDPVDVGTTGKDVGH